MKKIAYILSKIFFWSFALFSSFILLFSILSFFEYFFNWNIPLIEISTKENENYVSLKVPFIKLFVQFLLSYTVILMWFTFVYYSFYFYILQSFFEIFIAEKTFESRSLHQLEKFYKCNFIPIIVGMIGVVIRYFIFRDVHFDEPHFFVIVHLTIAFFLYFYLDLIRKGNKIQQENDLTI